MSSLPPDQLRYPVWVVLRPRVMYMESTKLLFYVQNCILCKQSSGFPFVQKGSNGNSSNFSRNLTLLLMASKFKCIGSAMLLDFSYLYIQVITPSVIGLIDPGE